jgi:transcription initiation factor IIE alpha subunit
MSLKLRTMKILKKNRDSARKLKADITLCLQSEEANNRFIASMVLSALRRVAKEEHHASNTSIVVGELRPAIVQLDRDRTVWTKRNKDSE